MDYKLHGMTIRIMDSRPYKPSSLTELLANSMDIKKNSVVADIGTGCGILAILASKLGAKKVYAIDIDENCRSSVEANSEANKTNNVFFLKGDMLRPLKEKVDVIIASLPQMPSQKKIDVHRHGSTDGTKYNLKLVKEAPRYLNKNGALFFSLMSISNPMKILNEFGKRYYATIVATKERVFDKKRFGKLSKGLSNYIFDLNKRDKAILYYRNGKWYYVSYIIKAGLR